MTARLDVMEPADDWDPSPHRAAIDRLRRHREEFELRVWCGDWCKDCRAIVPSFAAGLQAAGIDPASVHQYPVEKDDDGSKTGPLVEEYDVSLIPTIVLERNGTEIGRFEESADRPPIAMLAEALESLEHRQDAD